MVARPYINLGIHSRQLLYQQLAASLLRSSSRKDIVNVIHVPPKSKAIDKLARQTCKELAKQKNPVYRSLEVVEGFAEFLNIVAEMKAQQLNHRERLKEQHGGP